MKRRQHSQKGCGSELQSIRKTHMSHVLKPWRIALPQTRLLCIFFAACFAPIVPAFADDAGISVTGVGVAKGQPSVVEIGARLIGEGDLAADASVKYNDLRKKAVAALDALKDPYLSIEFGGPSVGLAPDPGAPMRLMQGIATDNAKRRVQISEQVKLVLKGVEKLEKDRLIAAVLKVIDTARDAGLVLSDAPSNYIQMQLRAQSGQSGDTIVVFKIPDRTELETQAYEKAVANARARAERIAKLSGVKLGRVSSVQDQGILPEGNSTQSLIAAVYGSALSAPAPETKEVESSALTEIPVTVRLTVKFEIEKQ
jgi:uncharacterized protein YggE